MKPSETKLLRTMYNNAKKGQIAGHFTTGYYPILDVLKEIEVDFDEVSEFVQQGQYIELLDKKVIKGGIRITHDGILYGQDKFDKKPMGFVPPEK